MAGVDTVRGIAFQQWHAVLEALGLLADDTAATMRVEGMDDVVDIEILDHSRALLRGIQVKSRDTSATWGQAELKSLLLRWAALPAASTADFEFVTNGRLGPSAEPVRDALEQARKGSTADLASILGVDKTSPTCANLQGASVRHDAAVAGELANRAVADVVAMLPVARTGKEAWTDAENAVLRLFHLLLDRAGRTDPDSRIVTRAEIADVLGVGTDRRRVTDWPGGLRDRYLSAAAVWRRDGSVAASLVSLDGPSGSSEAVTVLLSSNVAAVGGRTGSGKTTAVGQLVRTAAADGVTVVPANAEAYVPGRLAALIADSVAGVLDEPVPVSSGRQMLADRSLTVVIDGASEIAPDARAALRDDLQSLTASRHGAAIVVAGRDVAAIRALFPSSVVVPTYSLRSLDRSAREEIAQRVLTGTPSTQGFGAVPNPVLGLTAQVEAALGDAAGNPLLFNLAADLLVSGVEFTDVVGLYAAFVTLLGQRTNTDDMAVVSRGLGVAFAALLDDQRRYADRYSWIVQLDRAAATLAPLVVDATALDRGARRAGLVNSIGAMQTVVPFHDSFADYLAALAHSAGLAPLPAVFHSSDEQRLLFSNATSPLDSGVAIRVAQELPLLIPRLARDENAGLPAEAPDVLTRMLSAVLPIGETTDVKLWRVGDGRVAAFRVGDRSEWVGEGVGRELFAQVGSIVTAGGLFDAAARLWRQVLQQRLSGRRSLPAPTVNNATNAAEAVRRHVAERASTIGRVVATTFTDPATQSVLATVGSTGMNGIVSNAEQGPVGTHHPLTYRPSDVTHVEVGVEDTADAFSTRTTVQSFLNHSPTEDALGRIRKAVNELAGVPGGWL